LIGVQIVANTTEPSPAILNAGSWLGLGIQPSTSVTVTGNFDGAVVDLVGASNVGINGNNLLTISNTNNAGLNPSVIRFSNDASNNQVLGCTLLGSTTAAITGVITFSNGIATGNDNNTISNNTIGAAGANLPRYGILSVGTVGFENSGNTVSNNSISDFF